MCTCIVVIVPHLEVAVQSDGFDGHNVPCFSILGCNQKQGGQCEEKGEKEEKEKKEKKEKGV